MKRFCGLVVVIVLTFFSSRVSAEFKKVDLARPAPLTEGGMLLNQVDLLCLYFSSERIAHAASLFSGNRVEVDSTILDPRLGNNLDQLQNFVGRQITTFVSVLQERLTVYAPKLAKKFDPKTDVRFVIDWGPERIPLAVWEGGEWRWVEASAAAGVRGPNHAASDVNAARTSGLRWKKSKGKWCDCPALRKK